MPTLKRPLPVLIIGNGPVGLLLAYGLVKQDGEYAVRQAGALLVDIGIAFALAGRSPDCAAISG